MLIGLSISEIIANSHCLGSGLLGSATFEFARVGVVGRSYLGPIRFGIADRCAQYDGLGENIQRPKSLPAGSNPGAPFGWWEVVLLRNLSGLQIAQELDINRDDARAMIGQLCQGIVDRRPAVVLEGEVECEEIYVVAGQKGHPEAFKRRLSRRICGCKNGGRARFWLDRRASPPAFTFAPPR